MCLKTGSSQRERVLDALHCLLPIAGTGEFEKRVENMTEIAGRTAFITGGANGIGLGIARALAGAGAKIAMADVDNAALERAKNELSAVAAVETTLLDVRDRDAYERAADLMEAKLGPVSLLFNNAGVAFTVPVAKVTYELWDWSIGINLFGVFNGLHTFLPRMVARGEGGHIINTASGSGLAGIHSGLLYTTAKFGVVGMTESLRIELRDTQIGVSVFCPGPVATDIHLRSAASGPGNPDLTDTEQENVSKRASQMRELLQRGATPDVAGRIVLAAVQRDQFFIHTDRIMLEAIEARHQELIGAMPAAKEVSAFDDFVADMGAAGGRR